MQCVRCSHPLPPRADRCLRCFALNPDNAPLHDFGPIVFGCQAPDSGNAEILAKYGTPEQKERFLRPLLENEIVSCFSMTEPDTPGSDPTQLKTRGVRDGHQRENDVIPRPARQSTFD